MGQPPVRPGVNTTLANIALGGYIILEIAAIVYITIWIARGY